MATRSWESSYQDLLNCVGLPSLEYRRLETRLCTLYKIIYNLCYFEHGIFTLSTTLSHRVHHNLVLNRPFARTNSYFYSFVPHTISIWNNLDSSVICASLSSFRNKLHSVLLNKCKSTNAGLTRDSRATWYVCITNVVLFTFVCVCMQRNMSSISICCYLHASLSIMTELL